VADNYLTVTYVDFYLGSSVRQALFKDGTSTYKTAAFLGICYMSTADIQSAIRTAGHTPPTTTTDEFIKLATLGSFVRLAYSRPDNMLALPDDFDQSPMARAYERILTGDIVLDIPEDDEESPGSVVFNDPTATATGYPPIFTRRNMYDY
jgi:hypothetical protein